VKILNYNKLREWLAEQEHIQWEHWSKALSNRMDNWVSQDWSRLTFEDNVKKQIEDWKKNWKPYKELPDHIKDYDREWVDKILDNLPFKCPVYQCGGLMVAKERPYPKGMGEDDFPDGMVGDNQTPDLVCTNCKAVYHFDGFKNKRKLHKPEVNSPSLLQNNKKEDGVPPTAKPVGIPPKIL